MVNQIDDDYVTDADTVFSSEDSYTEKIDEIDLEHINFNKNEIDLDELRSINVDTILDSTNDDAYNEFYSKYISQDSEKVLSYNHDYETTEYNLKNDLLSIQDNISNDEQLLNYNDDVKEYLKNEELNRIFSQYGILKDEFLYDFYQYRKGLNQNLENQNEYLNNDSIIYENDKTIDQFDLENIDFSIIKEENHNLTNENDVYVPLQDIESDQIDFLTSINLEDIDIDDSITEENNDITLNNQDVYETINEETNEMIENFSSIISERINYAETDCKNLYEFYEEQIKIGDNNYYGTPHYDSENLEIYYNEDYDTHNILGPGTCYLHEVGHLLDEWAGNGHAHLSDDIHFSECLKDDYSHYIADTMMKNKCNYEEAMAIVSEEIKQEGCESISDLYGAISNNQCKGYWTHSNEYWSTEKHLEKEAFAHFFENSCNDPRKLINAHHYFPTAYATFLLLTKEGVF